MGNQFRRRPLLVFGAIVVGSFPASPVWAQGLVNKIPQPPLIMPPLHPAAIYYALGTWLLAAIIFVLLLREAWRTRSALPLAISVAGAIGVFVAPIYDSNMHVWFAPAEPLLFRSYDIGYPWYALIGESMMAGPIYWMYRQFREGVSSRALWIYFGIWWLYQAIIEVPGNMTNAYIYYGAHPFRIMGFPIWLGLCLGFGLPLAGYVVYKLREVLTGTSLLVMTVIMVPVTLFGSQLIGWPMWVSLNGGAGPIGMQLAAIASLVLSLAGYHCLILVYAKDRSRVIAAGDAFA